MPEERDDQRQADGGFGRYRGDVDGQIITFFVMTVAAAEAAVGLALIIALFRHRESLNPDAFTSLKW
jgi:NADH-quinone oxidoreductase subunit K